MVDFEYMAVPAPQKGLKIKGVSCAGDRFAMALADCMNELAADGWEYLRSDTLPSVERRGLAFRRTVYHTVMVFRRIAPQRSVVIHSMAEEIVPIRSQERA